MYDDIEWKKAGDLRWWFRVFGWGACAVTSIIYIAQWTVGFFR